MKAMCERSTLLLFVQHLCSPFLELDNMGHACAKEDNAEKVERRRIEREMRLGIYRGPSTPQLSQPTEQKSLTPNGIWPRKGIPLARNNDQRLFLLSQLNNGSRVPNEKWRQPRFQQPQREGQNQPRDSTPDRRTIGNVNSPFNDIKLNQSRGHVVEESDEQLHFIRPVVAQALNQLCSIELQSRVQVVNEELQSHADIVNMLESLHEVEALRMAAKELTALELRSRNSLALQEEQERNMQSQWIMTMLEEVRLQHLVRQTQDRQSQSHPTSRRSSPAKGQEAKKDYTDSFEGRLAWVPESANERPSVRLPSSVSTVLDNTPDPQYRLPSEDFARISYVSDRIQSQEEDALNAKIARQRLLLENTRTMYRGGDVAPVRAPPQLTRVQSDRRLTASNDKPFRTVPPPPLTPLVEANADPILAASAREASIQATKSRLSALNHYK